MNSNVNYLSDIHSVLCTLVIIILIIVLMAVFIAYVISRERVQLVWRHEWQLLTVSNFNQPT